MPKFLNKRMTRDEMRNRLTQTVLVKKGDDNKNDSDRKIVEDWLTHLHLFEGVPFNYLVPDVRMLPTESIRFFQVDTNWVEAMTDGAFNPGNSTAAITKQSELTGQILKANAKSNLHQVRRKQLGQTETPGTAPELISGFFLRSAVVSGWPTLEVNAYADTAGIESLSILRFERLAPALLIALFAGTLARVDIHEPSEGLHFGVMPIIAPNPPVKDLRYATSDPTNSIEAGQIIEDSGVAVTVPVPFRAGSRNVISINTLASTLQPLVWPPAITPGTITSAEFALELVQGVELVSFQVS
jgi:hypothetical protein